MNTALLTKGSGYWDTTEYAYRCCKTFRRAKQDMLVQVTGNKKSNDLEFTFVDPKGGRVRTAWTSVLKNQEGGTFLL